MARRAQFVRWDSRPYRTPSRRRQASYRLALLEWQHRLAADQRAANLTAIQRVHAASARLQPSLPAARQPGPDKQETPEVGASEASTDAMTLAEVERGCSPESA